MRTPIAALGALLLVTISLGAQQSAGVLSHPVASPVLPDIVAFDRVVNDRQELQFLRLSSQQTFSSTKTVTDLPWDPALDAPLAHGDPLVTFIGESLTLRLLQDTWPTVPVDDLDKDG